MEWPNRKIVRAKQDPSLKFTGQKKYFILSLLLASVLLLALLWFQKSHQAQKLPQTSYTLLSEMMKNGVPDFSLPALPALPVGTGPESEPEPKSESEPKPEPELKAKQNPSTLFSLSQLKGKWILIHFWASWCAPCISELPSLLSMVKALQGELQLVAISLDSEQKDLQDFQQKFLPPTLSPHIHLLWDKENKIRKLYAVNKLPVSFLITPEHKLFRRFLGAKEWDGEPLKSDLKTLVQRSSDKH